MSTKRPKLCSVGDSSVAADADRLSALPDALLHHVLSFLRAVAPLAPPLGLRVWRLGRHLARPEEFSRFVYRFLLEREASALVDTLRLLSSPVGDYIDEEDYTTVDVDVWIQFAIKRRARVIHLAGHPLDEAFFDLDRVSVISCLHLVHLKLTGCSLREKKLRQLCCSLATATVVLNDSFLNVGYEYRYKDIYMDALEKSIDGNSDSSLRDDAECGSDTCSVASTCEYSEILTGYEDKRFVDDGEDHDHCKHCNCYNHGPYWSGRRYGHRNISGAGQILGGHNVLCSLSNATSLELLADSGEAVLNRELKTCPVFRNLKTLSLGEWCMAADFDSLVSLLRHSPNLERLFLELKLDRSRGKVMEDNTIPERRSFSCTHLKMVKIKCFKNDSRVHLLAQLFLDNGVPIENIYTRRNPMRCCGDY